MKNFLVFLCSIGLLYACTGVGNASASRDESYIAHRLTDAVNEKAKFSGSVSRVISMRCVYETPNYHVHDLVYYFCVGKMSTWEYGIPPRYAWEVMHDLNNGSISLGRTTRLPA